MQENSKICKSSLVVFRSHYPNSTEFFLISILGHNSRVLVEFIFRILIISHFSVKKNNYAYLLSTFFGSALRKKKYLSTFSIHLWYRLVKGWGFFVQFLLFCEHIQTQIYEIVAQLCWFCQLAVCHMN